MSFISSKKNYASIGGILELDFTEAYMIIGDFHTHSVHSADSETGIREQIESAIDKGLSYICFTEHMDRDYVTCDGLDFCLDTDSYYSDYVINKDKYKDLIKVLFGVEYGLVRGCSDDLVKYSKEYDFDFIIGSLHLVDGKDPYYPSFYEGRMEKAAYLEYFECELDNARQFENYDVLGHLDYVVRYGPNKNEKYNYSEYGEIIDEILRTIISKGKGIEINTGGFRNGIRTSNPSIDVIKRYRQLGGEIITVGSDAHSTEYIAHCFDKAEAMLIEAGFKYYTIFENRKPIFIKI